MLEIVQGKFIGPRQPKLELRSNEFGSQSNMMFLKLIQYKSFSMLGYVVLLKDTTIIRLLDVCMVKY